MKKIYYFIILEMVFLFFLGTTISLAKYTLNRSAKVFQINSLSDEFFDTTSPGTITGKILTENVYGKYKSLITLYKTSDTAHSQPISQIETNEDGTFSFILEDIEMYDIVISKTGYLSYTILQIQLKHGKTSIIPDYKLKAGDIKVNHQIDMLDWQFILNNINRPITARNQICDVNEDGVIDTLDKNIVDSNYALADETIILSP